MVKLTQAEFIAKAVAKHGARYDYSQTVYTGYSSKVIIVCKDCRLSFLQFPSNHLRGIGCPKCGHKKQGLNARSSKQEFVSRAIAKHGEKYNYDRVVYLLSGTKVIIRCNTCCADFEQSPQKHLSGEGCPSCGRKRTIEGRRLNNQEFIQRAIAKHGDLYNYDQVLYVDGKTKVNILCNVCGIVFNQNPTFHLRGTGCPSCVNKAEAKIGVMLRRLFKKVVHHPEITIGKSKHTLDYAIADFDPVIYIEYNGAQHYHPVNFSGKGIDYSIRQLENTRARDALKSEFCKKNAIPLIVVPYWEEYPVWYVEYEIDRLLESSKIVYK